MSAADLPRIAMNDFRAAWADLGDDAHAAFARVGQSGWFVLGREVASFERALAPWFDARHAVGCASGLDALEIALRALDVAPGDKVLTTPLSAFATTLAILKCGAVPVFVDVDARGAIDLERAAAALERDPTIRFLLPVHLFGMPMDLDHLQALAARHDVRIIEDCAQSIGAAFGGRKTGSVGRCAGTSFYPTKNLGCFGDGGAFLTSDDALADRARSLRDYGQSAKYVHDRVGMNSRLDELHAAILERAMMPRLEGYLARRRAIARRYADEIVNPLLAPLTVASQAAPVWHLYPVIVEGDRDALQRHLRDAGIDSAVHYPIVIPDQRAIVEQGTATVLDPLERARLFAARELSLPIHPYMDEAAVTRVVDACNAWARP